MNKLIKSAIATTILSTSLFAEVGSSTYLGIKTGTLSFDKSVIQNTSGYVGVGPYTTRNEASLTGIEMGTLTTYESSFIFGYSFD
ncbi:hypothetical protein, partial [Poseidonibacter sp.]|uniref:hypothetical protein n=1 Tax=Poseidonibacter sp. TaxID=2321188 RepID=UPI003C766592